MKKKITARLFIGASEGGITAIGLGKKREKRDGGAARKGDRERARRWEIVARDELRAYFAGRLRSFSVPCDLGRLPRFTRAVLKITGKIPYGEVRSYRWVAKRLGKPQAARAVGNALARNPVPVVIPCHRVVRGDGSLGGFALGLSWKRRLLDLERSRPAPPRPERRR